MTEVSCAAAPLLLPEIDVVYDELPAGGTDADGAATVYPVGTVLMYPETVDPAWARFYAGLFSTPWFIVFKLCPASLLRGAVPVGRGMTCLEGAQPAEDDPGAEPFDETMIEYFEARCQAACDSDSFTEIRPMLIFKKFMPK